MDPEKSWVAAALRGDQQAFAHLIDTYKNPVYNLCYRMLGSPAEAEDAAQETFLRIYIHLGAYDPQRKLSSWVLAVASHYCIDRLRRQHIKWLSLDEILPWQPLHGDTVPPEDAVIESESCAEVQELLQFLSAEDRLVVILRYWQDLGYAEIAQITGATESAVKSRLHRTREALAQRVMAQRDRSMLPTSPIPGERRIGNAVL